MSRAGRARARVLGFACAALLAAALPALPLMQRAELLWLDAQWTWLRHALGPRALAPADDPILVGIDEASLESIAEPFALWHRPLGEMFRALAAAQPRGVLVDIALPERSFDGVLPGSDAALLGGVAALTRVVPTVIAVMVGPDGSPRPILPSLRAVGGPQRFIPALLPLDEDGSVRRIAYAPAAHGGGEAATPTLAEALAAQLLGQPPADNADRMIDFSSGRAFDVVPLHEVLRAHRAGQADVLRQRFAGRPVVVGNVLAFADPVNVPVALAAWTPGRTDVPGALVHAQALRSLLGGRAVSPVPAAATLLLALLAAGLWWLPSSAWRGTAAAVLLPVAAAASTLALHQGHHLPMAAAVLAAGLTLVSRELLEAGFALREKARLRAEFAGYVSPQVLQRLLADRLDPSRPDGPRVMAFLFADLRGFTTRGQHEQALQTVQMLNRYYDTIIPPIHAEAGMVDNFRGDGIMVVFGAPQPLADPALAALRAAAGMVHALARLNVTLQGEGRSVLQMGLGIACGEAVAGEVGSRQRHDYTAIGDAVNVAARLQDLCKPHGADAVVTGEVAGHAAASGADVHALGDLELKGHTPVSGFALKWPTQQQQRSV